MPSHLSAGEIITNKAVAPYRSVFFSPFRFLNSHKLVLTCTMRTIILQTSLSEMLVQKYETEVATINETQTDSLAFKPVQPESLLEKQAVKLEVTSVIDTVSTFQSKSIEERCTDSPLKTHQNYVPNTNEASPRLPRPNPVIIASILTSAGI